MDGRQEAIAGRQKSIADSQVTTARSNLSTAPDDATREEIERLVEAVHGHARTLSLLAPAIRARGVAATRETLTELMAEMEQKFPGHREKSLFASVELSLQRMSPENRERARVLGLFHGGVNLDVLATMMEWQKDDVDILAAELIVTGLATMNPYNHLTLHPALCPYLRAVGTRRVNMHSSKSSQATATWPWPICNSSSELDTATRMFWFDCRAIAVSRKFMGSSMPSLASESRQSAWRDDGIGEFSRTRLEKARHVIPAVQPGPSARDGNRVWLRLRRASPTAPKFPVPLYAWNSCLRQATPVCGNAVRDTNADSAHLFHPTPTPLFLGIL
uniref:Uncharacterized protein n=1 Tax=Candidatus Kentrum sp. DK TaxID=2126562 RepID=A0A450S0D0_9GAMM|nr:MAG: hypothetical protein BECKDK2373B_GA0170837_100862 [Candidatus Kentron sp. DK]